MLEIKTKRYFNCLACNKGEFTIEHLIGEDRMRTWGTWYCDLCGEGHRGATGKGSLVVELTGDKRLWTSVLLKLDPNAGDVYLIVRGMHFTKRGEMPKHPWFDENNRFFYNEHTCPTNYLKDVIEILQVSKDGSEDTDPHSIFEYVMSSPPLYDEEEEIIDKVKDRLELFRIPTDSGASNG